MLGDDYKEGSFLLKNKSVEMDISESGVVGHAEVNAYPYFSFFFPSFSFFFSSIYLRLFFSHETLL